MVAYNGETKTVLISNANGSDCLGKFGWGRKGRCAFVIFEKSPLLRNDFLCSDLLQHPKSLRRGMESLDKAADIVFAGGGLSCFVPTPSSFNADAIL